MANKKPAISLPEIPREIPFIVKKIQMQERDVYVIKVSLSKIEPLSDRLKFLSREKTDWYSAWEIPKPQVEYYRYTQVNNFILGQLGTQVILDEENASAQRIAFREEAYQAIIQASKKALDGKPQGEYLIVTNNELPEKGEHNVPQEQPEPSFQEATGSATAPSSAGSAQPAETASLGQSEEFSPEGSGEVLQCDPRDLYAGNAD